MKTPCMAGADYAAWLHDSDSHGTWCVAHVRPRGTPMHGRSRTPPGHGETHGTLLSHHGLLTQHLLLLLPLYGCKGGGGADRVEGSGGLWLYGRGHACCIWCTTDCRWHGEPIQMPCMARHM